MMPLIVVRHFKTLYKRNTYKLKIEKLHRDRLRHTYIMRKAMPSAPFPTGVMEPLCLLRAIV